MKHFTSHLIDKKFYESIVRFEDSEAAQEHYYRIMNTPTGKVLKNGQEETVRDQILRVYAMRFGDDLGVTAGQAADLDIVAQTADRLYIGSMGFDPDHWYRMQHHFPVIDEDNFDRFAALVIADLKAGSLHDAAKNGGSMLLVGEADPLQMTQEERQNQSMRTVDLIAEGVSK